MRFPGLRTLSGRIIIGFAVLILTFGAVSVLTVTNMERLGREIRVIRVGYLRLALIAKDLAEKQNRMRAYLLDDVTDESTTGRVEARVRRFRAARNKLLGDAEKVLEGLSGVPRMHRSRMNLSSLRIAEMRRQVTRLDPLYDKLLAAPPIKRLETAPGLTERHRKLVLAALDALEVLRKREGQLYSIMWQFERQQRLFVEGTAKSLEKNERRLRVWTMYLGLTAALVGMLIIMWATLTLRPLRRLRDAARRIASGDYASRIPEKGATEVADLAREFNIMGQAIEERERQLVRSERLVAVGKMAAMITHEVRNPLSSIGLNTELLEEELAELPPERADEARALCRAIYTEVDRLTAITEEYLQFARLPKPKLQSESLNHIVDDLVRFEREQLALRGVSLESELAGGLPNVLVDDSQVRQALLNLIRNGADAVEEIGGGSVTVVTSAGEGDQFVEVTVVDDGPGISEELVPKVFDPFFSTKDGGTGLGLALTHQIIQENGGSIRVKSTPGHGARFVVSLPVASPEAMAVMHSDKTSQPS
jgi:signal transduction histidine kinase